MDCSSLSHSSISSEGIRQTSGGGAVSCHHNTICSACGKQRWSTHPLNNTPAHLKSSCCTMFTDSVVRDYTFHSLAEILLQDSYKLQYNHRYNTQPLEKCQHCGARGGASRTYNRYSAIRLPSVGSACMWTRILSAMTYCTLPWTLLPYSAPRRGLVSCCWPFS